MIYYQTLFYLLVSTIILSSDKFSIAPSFGTVIDGNVVYDNPFLGGFNKPKIQWVDWDNDMDEDLFILDEDGCLKYFIYKGMHLMLIRDIKKLIASLKVKILK